MYRVPFLRSGEIGVPAASSVKVAVQGDANGLSDLLVGHGTAKVYMANLASVKC